MPCEVTRSSIYQCCYAHETFCLFDIPITNYIIKSCIINLKGRPIQLGMTIWGMGMDIGPPIPIPIPSLKTFPHPSPCPHLGKMGMEEFWGELSPSLSPFSPFSPFPPLFPFPHHSHLTCLTTIYIL